MPSASGRVLGRSGSSSAGIRRYERTPSTFRAGKSRGGIALGTGQELPGSRKDAPPREGASHTLPIGKLMGIPRHSRLGLKANGITTCGQLLAFADKPERRVRLARASGITSEELTIVIDRADMARVNGIGWMFGMMLESLGVRTVAGLARREPGELHALLKEQNTEHRLARRSPTLEEVGLWVAQARTLEGKGRTKSTRVESAERRRRDVEG